MSCKIHPSNRVDGVCASCLRERLSVLATAIADAGGMEYSPENRWKLGRSVIPRRGLFPRSDSPDFFGLRPADSTFTAPNPDLHRTPELRSNYTAVSDGCRRRFLRFPIISRILGRWRNREAESDREASKPSSTGSWWYSIIRGRGRRNKSTSLAAVVEEEKARGKMHAAYATGRGLSPAEKEDTESEFDSESGYTSEPSGIGRPSTSSSNLYNTNPYHNRHRFSGFAPFLTPLMKPRPGHPRSQTAAEMGYSGELKGTFNPNRHRVRGDGGSSVLGPNRSRKIADYGKFR
ncbi:hypothetical protein HPP92_021754 [Vanilla planifolia]|uniref:Uncharacterized protein n=1 Tax=Vanilla planifolia TaxID=51239 RepID=A0A835PUF8_VANPL|nr:hypothetical protein HPP92_021754 [Vanilla planifolia]